MSAVVETPAGSRWWGIALAGVSLFCIGIAAVDTSASAARVGVVAVVFAVYGVFFLTVVRRAAEGSALSIVAIVGTIVTVAGLTALVPGTATFQFWVYPLLWALCSSVAPAMIWSFVTAVAVFAGFAVSTGHEPGWAVTAALTQSVSFGVSVALGLWITGVYRYGEDRQRLLDELTAAQDELAALHRDAGVTAERERISREVHDTIAQSLAGTVLLTQRARREQAAGRLDDATLELVEDAARAALAETRGLVAGNAPVELHAAGLADALETLAARFRRETDVDATVEVDGVTGLDRETEVVLLRCAQEALSNVRKHAHASKVRVVLEGGPDAAVLRVRDDGAGFDPRSASEGFGLAGLRTRLGLVGGTLEVRSDGGATELVATVSRNGGIS